MANGQRVVTPRKRKVWAGYHANLSSIGSVAGPEVDDLLLPAATDIGLTTMYGVTVMRAVGFMQLVANTGTASTPAWNNVRIGFAWFDERLATATSGSGLVPRPSQDGMRETRWYQQWVLGGVEPSTVVAGTPINGDAAANYGRVDFDVTNMQKAPTADSKFVSVWYSDATWEAGTVDLQIEVDFLLALP